mmetsp:Transcript_11066/g.23997  ORF Transcript_11066/g.23997 Transcript_11066/m.23997 type:complete len:252 (-) Transcript_11066:120-875(-)
MGGFRIRHPSGGAAAGSGASAALPTSDGAFVAARSFATAIILRRFVLARYIFARPGSRGEHFFSLRPAARRRGEIDDLARHTAAFFGASVPGVLAGFAVGGTTPAASSLLFTVTDFVAVGIDIASVAGAAVIAAAISATVVAASSEATAPPLATAPSFAAAFAVGMFVRSVILSAAVVGTFRPIVGRRVRAETVAARGPIGGRHVLAVVLDEDAFAVTRINFHFLESSIQRLQRLHFLLLLCWLVVGNWRE